MTSKEWDGKLTNCTSILNLKISRESFLSFKMAANDSRGEILPKHYIG